MDATAANAGEGREVVAGLLVRDGRVLLCHRFAGRQWFPDVWDLPGGHVECGEPPINALARELEEELGIRIQHLGRSYVELSSPNSPYGSGWSRGGLAIP